MIKKVFLVIACCCIAFAVAVVFPSFCSSEEFIDDNATCTGCHVNGIPQHDIGVMHDQNHFVSGRCDDCHETPEGTGSVKATSCLACHPADQAGPGVNAEKCVLIKFHLDNADYQASGESCLASGCHLDQCDGEVTTTTSALVSTTTIAIDEGGCPATEIYGEGSREVEVMRVIRDGVLSLTPEGREIIRLYYQWAPFIALAIRNDEQLRSEIKEMIEGILSFTAQ